MISGVILAAGSSRRLGQPKQLLPVAGRPLLQFPIDIMDRSQVDEIVVVLGHAAEEIERALVLPSKARVVVNPLHAQGQASSLAAGLQSLHPESTAAVFLLGDQPFVPEAMVNRSIDAWKKSDAVAVRVTYRGRPSHPVVIENSLWPRATTLDGDVGARDLLASLGGKLVDLEADVPLPLEVDTLQDYHVLLRTVEPGVEGSAGS